MILAFEIKKHNEVIRLYKKENGRFFFQFGGEVGDKKNIYELDIDKDDIALMLNGFVENVHIKGKQLAYKLKNG